ncbi:WD40-repeat-containing domain protein [Hyaloraphidium curvatum]|nr:WD40-repeat-containing domain protein [Hyaloraphidium curvatum]
MSVYPDEPRGLTLDELSSEVHGAQRRAMAEQQAMLDELDRKRRARSLAVPTDDGQVRLRLREYGEPITLFGEGPGDRRERLREIMSRALGDAMEYESLPGSESEEDSEDEQDEEFYTEGSEELYEARRWIAETSLRRARKRIEAQQAELETPASQRKKIMHDFYLHLKTFSIFSSQLADDRPLTYCTFSPNSRLLATASWSGLIKLHAIPSCQHAYTFRGHRERVSGLAWHPKSTMGLSRGAANLASGAADGGLFLWSLEKDTPLAKLDGHTARVSRVEWHPGGRHLASSSYDTSWRLWDAETTVELLLQEGHAKEVYALGFQNDGSLLGTGGFDCHGHLWDMRTGRSVMILSGHVKPILCLDWAPDGYTIATGAEDNVVRIWDIRQRKCTYTLPGHTNIVTGLKIWNSSAAETFVYGGKDEDEDERMEDGDEGHANGIANGDAAMTGDGLFNAAGGVKPELLAPPPPTPEEELMRLNVVNGSFMVSCSYDGTAKLWSEGDWKPLRVFAGHDGKLVGIDISGDGKFVATAGYDRTFKLWASENVVL